MRFSPFILHDNLRDIRPDKCFLYDSCNDFQSVKNCLFQQFCMTSALTVKFIHSKLTETGENQYLPAVMKKYLHINQQFLQLLTVLIYMTISFPPHKEELMSIKWCNWKSLCNIYIHHEQVIVITGYHKTQWQVGTRSITWFLPTAINDFLMHYLIYVPLFLCFLHN